MLDCFIVRLLEMMVKSALMLSVMLLVAMVDKAFAQSQPHYKLGNARWVTYGDVSVDTGCGGSARIAGSNGRVYSNRPVSPFAIVQFDAHIKSSGKGVKGYSFVRFYDSDGKTLLEYRSAVSDSVNYQQTGIYTEAPPLTLYMDIGIEKDSSTRGYICVKDLSLKPNADRTIIKHKPIVDLDQYMRPFWNSDTIYNETVLLYSSNGKPAEGKLLFQPDKILSVRSFDLHTTYTSGKDYSLNGNVMQRITNSALP